MKFVLMSAVLTFVWWETPFAQSAPDAQRCEDSGLYRHIRATEPSPPNRPLRQDNISDDEVREVQGAALEVYPDAIVSISGVTEGCDCEDGSSCTAQVWLALFRENQTRSLVLSKIDGHWKVGAVQNWWLRYHAHQSSYPGRGRDAKQLAWEKENQDLLDAFPVCPTPPAKWRLMSSESDRWTCIDTSSMKVSGSIRRVKVKLVNAPPKKRLSIPWIRYSISWLGFDCERHGTRIDETTFYLSDGTAQKAPDNDSPLLWYPVRPNTPSGSKLDLVCGWSQ